MIYLSLNQSEIGLNGKIFETGMFSDVGEKPIGREMTECPVARSCRKWMLRQERNDNGRLIDGMMERAVDVMLDLELV